jgi:hypothetical protein
MLVQVVSTARSRDARGLNVAAIALITAKKLLQPSGEIGREPLISKRKFSA